MANCKDIHWTNVKNCQIVGYTDFSREVSSIFFIKNGQKNVLIRSNSKKPKRKPAVTSVAKCAPTIILEMAQRIAQIQANKRKRKEDLSNLGRIYPNKETEMTPIALIVCPDGKEAKLLDKLPLHPNI